ncbi:carboxypeptidase-like regulatory domain-containing protein [Chryseobacterium wanjuense]
MSVFTYAQKSYTINGIVKDKDTGERIAGATIKVKENPEITVETNEYGFYSLSLPENDYTLIISHNKHKEENKSIHLNEALKIDLALAKDDTLIEEVALKGKEKTAISQRNKMGADVLDIQSIAKLPVLFGERDVIKTIQFLPGISSQEGRTGFSVRGGEPDQNLILLDEAPVFNNSHLLGFFSTFNNDALKDVTVYKGNMPSQYGGRLSSIIDVKMKDGNNENFGVSGGIGLISSRLTVE